MDEMEWIGCICIACDDDISGCGSYPDLIGSPISLSVLKNDSCSFPGSYLPCFILGISINDNNLKIPVVRSEIFFIDSINGFSDTSFFIDSGNDNTNLQNRSLQGKVYNKGG